MPEEIPPPYDPIVGAAGLDPQLPPTLVLDPDGRLNRDDLFMKLTQLAALRSTCVRAHVGAVIAQDGRPISMGYNGAPPGLPHCLEDGCMQGADGGCERCIHAEANAIAWAARAGLSVEESTMYCTYSPCRACAQLIVSAGIRRFYFVKDYRLARLDILEAGLVEVRRWS